MNSEKFSFKLPTKIVYGQNSLKDINNYINNRKTLIITSKGFVDRGIVDKIYSYSNSIVDVISTVKSHPEFKDIRVLYELAYKKNFELIVAIGGGSVIDAAKFISVSDKSKDYKFVENLAKGDFKKKNIV